MATPQKPTKRELKAALEAVPQALRNLSMGVRLSPEDRQRRSFVQGDHWQESNGWRGPLPQGTPQDVVDEIAKYFTSTNKVAELVDRHLDAVIGLDPKWNWTVRRELEEKIVKDPASGMEKREVESLSQEEQKRAKRLNSAFTGWVDDRSVFWKIREKSESLLWNGSLILRLMMPPKHVKETMNEETGQVSWEVPLVPLEQSLARWRLMVVEQGQGAILYDEAGDPIGSVYKYKAKTEDKDERIEFCWLDEEDRTNLFTYNPRTLEFDYIDMDLGGRLLMFELRAQKTFVSDSLIQLNAQLNVALTMAGRNATQGGFLERVLINADLPGRFEKIPDGSGGYREVYVPDELQNGPNSILSLVGVEKTDPETGEPTGERMQPQMLWKEASNVSVFEVAARMFEKFMYAEARQMHAPLAGDAMSSGVARQQALQDFAMSINPTTREFVRAIRWVFETSIRAALLYSSEKIKIDDLKVAVECRLGTKFLTVEEQRLIMDKVEKKMIARETGMLELGTEDPAAEKALIKTEEAENPPPAQPGGGPGGAPGAGGAPAPNQPTAAQGAGKLVQYLRK